MEKHSAIRVPNEEFALQAGLVRSSFLPGRRVRTELLELPQYRAMLIVKQVDSEDAMTFAVPKPVATYLAAEAAKDADAISRCFTEDGPIAGATRSGNGKRRQTRNTTMFRLRSDFARRKTR